MFSTVQGVSIPRHSLLNKERYFTVTTTASPGALSSGEGVTAISKNIARDLNGSLSGLSPQFVPLHT
jgi:hypothetical protein